MTPNNSLTTRLLVALALGAMIFFACSKKAKGDDPAPTKSANERRVAADKWLSLSQGAQRNACAINGAKQVKCWGLNGGGQSSPPEGTFKAVSTDLRQSCGLTQEGHIRCWGKLDPDLSTKPPPEGSFVQLSGSCALSRDGEVRCWGYARHKVPGGPYKQFSGHDFDGCGVKENGQIQCWDSGKEMEVKPPKGVFKYVSFDSLAYYACALGLDVALKCWSTYASSHGVPLKPERVPPNEPYRTVSVGYDHSCGITVSGKVLCWGDNTTRESTPPEGVFKDVVAGRNFSCGITEDDRIICWGSGSQSLWRREEPLPNVQFPSPNRAYLEEEKAQRTSSTKDYLQVTVGVEHGCGLKTSGEVFCWGRKEDGWQDPPKDLFQQISSGWIHTCGLTRAGRVKCWMQRKMAFTQFGQAIPPKGVFKKVVCGGVQSCALTLQGELRCWGNKEDYPEVLPKGPFVEIDCAYSPRDVDTRSCALKASGEVLCWGWGEPDQGLRGLRYPPPDDPFVALAIDDSTCALTKSSSAICWGGGAVGEDAPPEGRFQQLVMAGEHACGLRQTGNILCWGDDNTSQSTPPAGRFTQIDISATHGCGVTEEGAIQCWGNCTQGQCTPP